MESIEKYFEEQGIQVIYNCLGATSELIESYLSSYGKYLGVYDESHYHKQRIYTELCEIENREKRTGFENLSEEDKKIRNYISEKVQTGFLEYDTLNIDVEKSRDPYLTILDRYTKSIANPIMYYSGGMDSEMVLKSFLRNNLQPKVVIFEFYHKDPTKIINQYDLEFAKKFCTNNNLNYELLAIDIDQLWNEEFINKAIEAEISSPHVMTHVEMIRIVNSMYPGSTHVFGGEVRFRLNPFNDEPLSANEKPFLVRSLFYKNITNQETGLGGNTYNFYDFDTQFGDNYSRTIFYLGSNGVWYIQHSSTQLSYTAGDANGYCEVNGASRINSPNVFQRIGTWATSPNRPEDLGAQKDTRYSVLWGRGNVNPGGPNNTATPWPAQNDETVGRVIIDPNGGTSDTTSAGNSNAGIYGNWIKYNQYSVGSATVAADAISHNTATVLNLSGVTSKLIFTKETKNFGGNNRHSRQYTVWIRSNTNAGGSGRVSVSQFNIGHFWQDPANPASAMRQLIKPSTSFVRTMLINQGINAAGAVGQNTCFGGNGPICWMDQGTIGNGLFRTPTFTPNLPSKPGQGFYYNLRSGTNTNTGYINTNNYNSQSTKAIWVTKSAGDLNTLRRFGGTPPSYADGDTTNPDTGGIEYIQYITHNLGHANTSGAEGDFARCDQWNDTANTKTNPQGIVFTNGCRIPGTPYAWAAAHYGNRTFSLMIGCPLAAESIIPDAWTRLQIRILNAANNAQLLGWTMDVPRPEYFGYDGTRPVANRTWFTLEDLNTTTGQQVVNYQRMAFYYTNAYNLAGTYDNQGRFSDLLSGTLPWNTPGNVNWSTSGWMISIQKKTYLSPSILER